MVLIVIIWTDNQRIAFCGAIAFLHRFRSYGLSMRTSKAKKSNQNHIPSPTSGPFTGIPSRRVNFLAHRTGEPGLWREVLRKRKEGERLGTWDTFRTVFVLEQEVGI